MFIPIIAKLNITAIKVVMTRASSQCVLKSEIDQRLYGTFRSKKHATLHFAQDFQTRGYIWFNRKCKKYIESCSKYP